jgi:Rieske 2Fe-2S family protein
MEGLIFVSAADAPPDFERLRERIEVRLRPHDLSRAKVCHRKRYEIAANWKLVVENSRECYHCGVGHPQYCRAVGFAAALGSATLQAEHAAIETERKREVRELGLETEEIPFFPDSWYHYRRFFLRSGFVTESMDGQPVAPLMGNLPDRNTGVFAVVTLPNLLLEASRDYVMTLRLTPKGPLLTEAEVCWLVRADAREGLDYDVDRLTEFWRLTSEQDWELCEDNQKGVNSSKYAPGAYGPAESGVEHFLRWYVKQLVPEKSPLEPC